MAINAARNLLESGNIDQTLKKSIEDSKKEVSNLLQSSEKTRKRKPTIYQIVNQRNIIF